MMMAPDQLEEDLGLDKDLESKKKKLNWVLVHGQTSIGEEGHG